MAFTRGVEVNERNLGPFHPHGSVKIHAKLTPQRLQERLERDSEERSPLTRRARELVTNSLKRAVPSGWPILTK